MITLFGWTKQIRSKPLRNLPTTLPSHNKSGEYLALVGDA